MNLYVTKDMQISSNIILKSNPMNPTTSLSTEKLI